MRWVAEWEGGIEGTDIKPGFIKIGVDPGPLSDIDRKLVRAAAQTHLETGLMIHCHTGEAEAALGVLETIIAEGVDPSALVIIHAADIVDWEVIYQILEDGAWASLDHVGQTWSLPIEQYAERIKEAIGKGFGDQILVSHDTGWYDVNHPDGISKWGNALFAPFSADPPSGDPYPHFAISDELVPALKGLSVTDESIHQLLVTNPAKVFTIEVRKQR